MQASKNSLSKNADDLQVSSKVGYKMFPKLDRKTRIFYSFGHIYNDLCASIWFSYTLLYFKLSFDDIIAGILLLLGQVADAFSTPLIGYGSDKNFDFFVCRYGRRKIWHLIGTICVACSFPFIFNSCFVCDNSDFWIKFSYYACFIALFQFGWAAVQVAHVSLITDLTSVSSQRVELNAYRQAGTVASSICVYSITLLLIGVEETTISKEDTIVFMKVVHLISVIGIIFSILFHMFVREPSYDETIRRRLSLSEVNADDKLSVYKTRALSGTSLNASEFGSKQNLGENKNTLLKDTSLLEDKRKSLLDDEEHEHQFDDDEKCTKIQIPKVYKPKFKKWSDWLKSINFWKMCVIYMTVRLFVNLTQVYTPLYLQETLRLPKRNIAIVPFVTYLTGFIFSLIAKPMSTRVGSKFITILGCTFGLFSCIWIFFGGLEITLWQVFSVAALFGIGGTAMLIGSLSLTADLIGDNIESGAFVFGSMSFFDKLVNGGVIAIIQHTNPLSESNSTENTILRTFSGNTTHSNETYTSFPSIIENFTQIFTSFNETLNHTDITEDVFENGTHLEPRSVLYYLHVLSFVSGTAVVLTLIALLTIIRAKFSKTKNINREST